jgi:hypothetical protein
MEIWICESWSERGCPVTSPCELRVEGYPTGEPKICVYYEKDAAVWGLGDDE